MKELGSWTEVDEALEEIGRVALEILALEAEMGVQVLNLLNEYGGSLDSLNQRKNDIESLIEAFCVPRKDEFNGKRSRQFTFGRIAFRLSEKIEIPDGIEGVAIRTLRDLGWDECVEVKERLDRTALKKLTDEHLAKCGLKRTVADRFRIEPNLRLAADKSGKGRGSCGVTIDMERLSGAVKVKSRQVAAELEESEGSVFPAGFRRGSRISSIPEGKG